MDKGDHHMSEEQLAKAALDVEKKFKIALLDQGMNQSELAKLINTTPPQVNMAIKGDTTPKSRKLRKQIAEILNIEK